jgi:hypothetical protein
MNDLFALSALALAVLAAGRSTWSPCGRSMLSTITPIGERGRGARYRATAAFFMAGALLGGAALGALAALLATALAALGLPVMATAGLAAAASLLAAASDSPRTAFALPIHRRQVNERWLDTFRPWFYGLGFGLQIGSGLATYITTASVYLFLFLAALSGRPSVALGAGLLFGLVRGSSVLLARHVTTPDALRALHLRLQALDARTTAVAVAGETTAALAALLVGWWPAALLALAVIALAAITMAVTSRTGLRRVPTTSSR